MDNYKHHEHNQQKHHFKDHNHHDNKDNHHMTHHVDGHSHNKDHGGYDHQDHHKHMVQVFKKRFLISLIITIPILVLSPMIQEFVGIKDPLAFEGSKYILFGLSTLIFFYGGWPFISGLVNELKSKSPGMMTLIALAISVAYFFSSAVVFGLEGKLFFWELATLIDIMLLGHWIEMKSVMGASRALEELAKLMPDTAHKISEDGNTEDVKVRNLKNEDKILIKPGEKIPADGEVYEGESTVNESMITGESKPVEKGKDDEVVGGAVNGEGSLKVIIKKTGDDTYLSKVIKLVKEAQESKSKTQNLADRAALWLTIIALSAGVITFAAWYLFLDNTFNFALTRAVTVMVITCPHALGLAIPLVVAVSTSLLAKNGLLIRNRNAFEMARNITTIIFDKTGTLTKGEFGVDEVIVINNDLDKKEILKLAATIEKESEHPIGKGILASVDETYELNDFNSIKGKGAEGTINGKSVRVVSTGYLKENNIEFEQTGKVEELNSKGDTVVFVLQEDKLIGAIGLKDVVREESKKAVSELKEMGIQSIMLTGDNEKVAKSVADEVGIENYFTEVMPDKKSEKVKEIQNEGKIIAMTGDGVNDAPALAQADIGIAIGSGTDVAAETADIILVKSNPQDVVNLIKFSKATYGKMIQNLIWATGYNAFAIPLAAGVLAGIGIVLSPAIGAVLMSLSTVIVAINAKLLKVYD
jgi:Cu2+-exporting ATPase